MVNHTEPSHEPLELANKELETTIVSSAQPEEAPMLVLHTIGPANRAYLEQDGTRRLSLHFRGLCYGVDDYLPSSVSGLSISPSVTAGEFVCRQMLRRYGYHEDEWPALARQFLLKHTTCQPERNAFAEETALAKRAGFFWQDKHLASRWKWRKTEPER